MEKLLTVFTPSYNRAHTLPRLYESLCKQTCKDFIWMIVDDGSTDGTRALVNGWKSRNDGFEIEYVYKENGGMHTAHNTAYKLITTELNVCIDSDDMLADDAVRIIADLWKRVKCEECAGIIGLDADFGGKILGTAFTQTDSLITLSGFYENGGKGDKKLVYRTDIMKTIEPYPEYAGEKLVPLSYKYLLCDQNYGLYPTNRVLCNVEYQQDGSSNNLWPQYIRSPRGFADFRKKRMELSTDRKRVVVDCIHYVSSSIIAKNKKYINESPKKMLTLIMTPIGIILSIYIHIKSRSKKK